MVANTSRRSAVILSSAALIGIIDSHVASAQERQDVRAAAGIFAVAEMAALEARPFEPRSSIRPDIHPLLRPDAVPAPPRPKPLVGLYVSFTALQTLDILSTHKALEAGAVEANPIVAPIAHSPLALTAVKAGVTAATIFASEQLWRRNRKAAVLTMIAVNAAYGAIAAHNYRVSAAQRR